jgi:hypothetical protein
MRLAAKYLWKPKTFRIKFVEKNERRFMADAVFVVKSLTVFESIKYK